MKKLICLLLCVCMVLGMAPGALAAQEVYLALGDDITAGSGLSDPSGSFAALLAKANGLTLENRGTEGTTTTDLYTLVSGGSLDSQIKSAGLITITGGGNEMLDLMYTLVLEQYNSQYDPDITAEEVIPIMENSSDDRWMNLLMCGLSVMQGDEDAGIPAFANRPEFAAMVEQFAAGIANTVKYIRNLNANVLIVVPTQYNPYQEFSGLYAMVKDAVDAAVVKLNKAITSNASAGYTVTDVYTAFKNSSKDVCNASTDPLKLDYLPNAAGHALIADCIQAVVDKNDQPEPTDPLPTEPKPTEPKPTEPQPTEPKPTEPQPTEPQPTEPQPTEPQPTEPKPTEPQPTEPEPTVPQPTEPEPTVPQPTEPDEDHEHSFGPWVTVWEATSEKEGLAKRFCVCGAEESKVLPKLKNPFTDIAKGKYYYEPVLWAVNRGITSGVTSTTFGPNQNCTRAQIVTFLWAAHGRPEPETRENPFTDVAKNKYYYKAVLWAVENGITSGLTKTTFGPNQTCTRAQVVMFLWASQGRPQPRSMESRFTDVKSGVYYYRAVLWAVENGITSGVTKTTFGPQNTCTRAQIATFLYKTFAAQVAP